MTFDLPAKEDAMAKSPAPKAANVAQALARVLADTHVLAVQTQNFHWNVGGARFHDLHIFFEKLYGELAGAIDGIAERMRAIGAYAPGSLRDYARLTAVEEADRALPADAMLRAQVAGHEAAAGGCRRALGAAQAAGDEVTADLMIERLAAHDKALWMLRSLLA
jgi:starvation-inducible DNA-binding protein